ncbi:hypothetical protein FBR42_13790 [Salmonella enterica subsp. enterica serovar Hull]|nr:hypothetical protein [Salmonella enterica subsp. enterica serovar Virchow]ECG7219815.1 hypothetical protein [Salmonella enterica subsp. enterica serovar Hull]
MEVVENVETISFMEACRRIAGAGFDPVEFFAGKEFTAQDRFIVKREGNSITLCRVSELSSKFINN